MARADLKGKKVLFLTSNEGVEQVELTAPWEAVLSAGADAVLAAPKAGKVQAFNHLDKADTFDADITTSPPPMVDEYDALVVPGGVANADQLRTDTGAVAIVRQMAGAGRPAAVICHGPWVLVEAEVARGRTLTSWQSLKTDLRNAGARWVDEEVVVCTEGPNVIVTSRSPADLGAFCREAVEAFRKGAAQTSAA